MTEGTYLVNDAGDVWARRLRDGTEEQVDPDSFGWRPKKSRVEAEQRRTLEYVCGLPGFRVVVEDGPSFVPGRAPEPLCALARVEVRCCRSERTAVRFP